MTLAKKSVNTVENVAKRFAQSSGISLTARCRDTAWLERDRGDDAAWNKRDGVWNYRCGV